MRPYGVDLREHILAAYGRGEGSIRDLAEQFGVAPRTVVNWLRLTRAAGSVVPRPHGGGAQAMLTGCVVDRSTIGRALATSGVTRKKRPPCDRA